MLIWARSILYNRTHVILGEGRRDWPVAGFPFIRDADRLRSLLLHRFRLVEQRQLIKLLNICNSPGKRKRRIICHLPERTRAFGDKISVDRMTGFPVGEEFHFVSTYLDFHTLRANAMINWHSLPGDSIYSAYTSSISRQTSKRYNRASWKANWSYRIMRKK